MKKYILRVLVTTDGERTYYHKGVHVLDAEQDEKEFVEDYAKEFWGDNCNTDENGDNWFFGEIITNVYEVTVITKEEYDVLNKFL